MGQPNFIWTLVVLLSYLELRFANAACSPTTWNSRSDHDCSLYDGIPVQAFKDMMADGKSKLKCCPEGDPDIDVQTNSVSGCDMSPCSPSPGKVHCPTRTIRGKGTSQLDEILREKCTTENGEAGYTSLCCPKGSLEGQLATVYGAEPNEFPHMAKLKLTGHCGGTIYNSRYIITAAHCIVSKETNRLNPASKMIAIIGANSGDNEDKQYVYQVEEAIPHEKYSKLYPNSETMKDRTLYDIAVLKVNRDIKFGPNVKAMRIAEPNFEPRDYANQTIIAGWGTTDTLAVSAHLQKANVVLRNPNNCFGIYDSYTRGRHWGIHSKNKEYKEQLLCIGGVLEGNWSPTAGGGDSGGPAICRGPNGKAILCGVTSYGGDDADCLKGNDETNCPPSIYARVSYFNDWIRTKAGDPAAEKDIFEPYLYGEPVEKGAYDHQVRITSATGQSCGGTLVSENIVITAASCIAKDDGSGHAVVKVHYGLNDLKEGKALQSYDVVGATYLEGFERVGENVDVKKQGHRIRITDNFYKNNLAAIKIDGKAPVDTNKLPGLPGRRNIFEEGREIAFPRSTHHGGKLSLREFHILDKDECQKRMTRLAKGEDTMGGASMKVGGDILCGVEKYSGGSLCDRELGGGLICKGEDGKDVLCGVQIFRLCEWSIPNAFMDMSQKSHWVKSAVEKL